MAEHVKKQIDRDAIREHIRGILVALGDDPDREGLKETPDRVARMYEEVFEGMNYTNDEIAEMFDKTFENELEFSEQSQDLVIVRDIDVFSYCEHHMALMYDMKVTVAYIPSGKVIGLSKIARIADMAAKRLQLQERIGSDIADIIENNLGIIRKKQGRETSAERIGEEIERLAVGIFGIFDNGYRAGAAHEYIVGVVRRDILIVIKLRLGKLAGFLVGAVYLCLFQRRCHNA